MGKPDFLQLAETLNLQNLQIQLLLENFQAWDLLKRYIQQAIDEKHYEEIDLLIKNLFATDEKYKFVEVFLHGIQYFLF